MCIEAFNLSRERLDGIARAFQAQLEEGLGRHGATIKALPTYVEGLPDGGERGRFLTIDLGGSNLRVGAVTLLGGGRFDLHRQKWILSEAVRLGDGRGLFDFMAGCLDDYLGGGGGQAAAPLDAFQRTAVRRRASQEEACIPLGFTFSYPVDQTALDRGTLLQWNKSMQCAGVVGHDVVRLLQEAIDRRGLPILVVALLNDTVGTLVAHRYCDREARASVILGTGTNAAYVEDLSAIGKLALSRGGAGAGRHMIVNVEWGALGDAGDGGPSPPPLGEEEGRMPRGAGASVLPLTAVDLAIDRESLNPGQQTFEKMISGMYLGELVRLYLEAYCGIGGGEAFSLTAADVAAIEESLPLDCGADVAGERSREVMRILQERRICAAGGRGEGAASSASWRGGSEGASPGDVAAAVVSACRAISGRSASLVAAGIVAIYRHLGSAPERTVVAFDGSIYENYPDYARRVRESVDAIHPGHSIELVLAKNASMVGAAVVLAVLASQVQHPPLAG